MIDQPEARCPNCGALVSAEASWCGQCYEPLSGRGRITEPPSPPGTAREPVVPSLPIERPSGQGRGEAPPHPDPVSAAIRSALVPGLGHWALGRRGDAVARFVLAVWFVGAAVTVLSGSSRSSGIVAFAVVFVGAALALSVSSAVDAYRIAEGRSPLVTPRMLLWASTIVVLASVLVGTILIIPSARGG